MIGGTMQGMPLRIIDILRFAARAHPTVEIVSRGVEGGLHRYDYRELFERVGRLANALTNIGVKAGDRVATLAWNTHRHLEYFFAAPGIGAVLHTVNPRLAEDQIVYVLNHGDSETLVFEKSFVPLVNRLSPKLNRIKNFIVLGDKGCEAFDSFPVLNHEQILTEQNALVSWPAVNEDAGAVLCYTSGTTGDPKGVLYSHRAVVLHALAAGLAGAFGITAFDVVMPCASMYHATAWGLPFIAPINGAKLVLPADKMSGPALHELISTEGVTFTGGVPTIWTMYLDYVAQIGGHTHSLRRVVIGGSAVPRAMAEAFSERHHVEVLQIWGMTELTPMGVVATLTPALLAQGEAHAQDVIWTRQGRLQFGVEVRIVDERGAEVPNDGETPGLLYVRGPWTIQRYFKASEDVADSDGWFETGDVATLDRDGYLRITDRTKDVIKSGGEWISSIDLENAAASFAGVRVAAVIGVPDLKWEERPILIIEPHQGVEICPDAIRAFLASRVAKWWLPERIYIHDVPLTAIGKIDKKALRARYCDQPEPQNVN